MILSLISTSLAMYQWLLQEWLHMGTQQYLFHPEAGEWGRKLLEPGIVLRIWRCCNNLPVATYMFLLCLLEFEFIGPFFQ